MHFKENFTVLLAKLKWLGAKLCESKGGLLIALDWSRK